MTNFKHLTTIEELGERMRTARENSALSVKDFGERAEISVDSLYQYFHAKREIGALALARFATIAGLTPNGFLMRSAPDSLEAAEFPRFPASRRPLIARILSKLHFFDRNQPAEFDPLKYFDDVLSVSEKHVREIRGAEVVSIASEEPAAYGETEAGESLDARASEAIALAIEELPDVTSPAALRLMDVQRALIERAGVPGKAVGAGKRGVGGESADGAEAAGVSAGASSLAAGPKHRQKRKPNK